MKEIEKGTKYELRCYSDDFTRDINPIVVGFVHNNDGEVIPGTTNEEVINMLIERFYALQLKAPAVDNMIVIHLLKSIRQLLAKRRKRKDGKKDSDSEE